MLQMPEFEAPGGASSGVRPTLPMADQRASSQARPEVVRTPVARRLAWLTLGLVMCAGLGLLLVEASGGRLGSWRSEPPPEEPTTLFPSPEGQTPPAPPATEEPEPSPAPEPPPAPSPRAPTPASTPPAKPAPAKPAPAPTLPTLPSPTAPTPAPPTPPLPSPPLPLPQLPWALPTAGACERCAQALRGSGHYTVVSAAGEALLCEDSAVRASCEREIDEAAPGVAERAAREGNCTAALATVAAVNVRVPAERFAAVNALCLR